MWLKNKFIVVASFLFVNISILLGQARIGVDIYSRYISRGIDYGNAPSLQPSISYTTGGFSFGAWGAYSISSSAGNGVLDTATGIITNTSNTFSEIDLLASYTYPTDVGTVNIYFTDYTFPYRNLKFFDYNGESHILEAGLGYTGTESFPMTIVAYYNFLNDVDKSIYLQASYPFTIDSVYSIKVFVGGTPSKSAWYSASKANFINVGITVSKTIVVTDSFSLPVSVSYIINPEIDQSHLIFGMSF